MPYLNICRWQQLHQVKRLIYQYAAAKEQQGVLKQPVPVKEETSLDAIAKIVVPTTRIVGGAEKAPIHTQQEMHCVTAATGRAQQQPYLKVCT